MTPEQWFKTCPQQNWVQWLKWFGALNDETRRAALAEAERLCRDPRNYRRPETAGPDLADAIRQLAEVERG